MAISPGRYRDELYPILARNAAENPQRTADSSAMGLSGYGSLGPEDVKAVRGRHSIPIWIAYRKFFYNGLKRFREAPHYTLFGDSGFRPGARQT
jgi:hypothetical protein